MKNHIITEICVDSLESAVIAQESGASRIELCDNLIVGGTTPSIGLVELCKENLSIDINVIIRPRSGDFCYSKYDIDVMKRDIERIKKIGINGVVIGALNPQGNINKELIKELIEIARPLSITFHRAFDRSRDLFQSLEDLMEMGVDRLLTSGGEETAIQGIQMLKELNSRAGDKIAIMPGSGINKNNAQGIINYTGVNEIHFSGKSRVNSVMQFRTNKFQQENNILLPEFDYFYTDRKTAKELTRTLK